MKLITVLALVFPENHAANATLIMFVYRVDAK